MHRSDCREEMTEDRGPGKQLLRVGQPSWLSRPAMGKLEACPTWIAHRIRTHPEISLVNNVILIEVKDLCYFP